MVSWSSQSTLSSGLLSATQPLLQERAKQQSSSADPRSATVTEQVFLTGLKVCRKKGVLYIGRSECLILLCMLRVPLLYLIVPTYVHTYMYTVADAHGKVNYIAHTDSLNGLCVCICRCAYWCMRMCMCVCVFMCTCMMGVYTGLCKIVVVHCIRLTTHL